MSNITQVEYQLYKRKDGGIGLSPYQEQVVLLPKSKMIYARKKQFNFEGKNTKKISMALSSELASDITNLEALLFDQYEKLFLEDSQEEPVLYSAVKKWNKVDWFTVKVTDDIKVYEKKGKKLEETTYEEMPEDVDIFPVLTVSSAWMMDMKGKPTFGLSFQIPQLFFRKNESASKKIKTENSPIALAQFI